MLLLGDCPKADEGTLFPLRAFRELQILPIMKEKIGFVGVGRMGSNMARRLVECGYDVSVVYDIHFPTAARLARELGTTHARTLAAVTSAADIVFTVVSDDEAQEAVYDTSGDSLLVRARRHLDLCQLRDDYA